VSVHDTVIFGGIFPVFYSYQYSNVRRRHHIATPNFTTIVTGHGNIKTYLHKYKITNNPMCPCKQGEQTVDHIIYHYKLHEQEREQLKAVMIRPDSWPVSKIKLGVKYYKKIQRLYREHPVE
jgi:hypothetical protein